MRELERALVADSAAASPSHILEGLGEEQVRRVIDGAPHSVYGEVWHVAFWQEVTLDWVRRIETPVPVHAADGFPAADAGESWEALRERFFRTLDEAAAVARDETGFEREIRCPSPEGKPMRVMTVREQMESLIAHNAYHFGRVVLLRQMMGLWPPASGGYTW